MSDVTCHSAHVTCHTPHVTCHTPQTEQHYINHKPPPTPLSLHLALRTLQRRAAATNASIKAVQGQHTTPNPKPQTPNPKPQTCIVASISSVCISGSMGTQAATPTSRNNARARPNAWHRLWQMLRVRVSACECKMNLKMRGMSREHVHMRGWCCEMRQGHLLMLKRKQNCEYETQQQQQQQQQQKQQQHQQQLLTCFHMPTSRRHSSSVIALHSHRTACDVGLNHKP